MTSFNSLALLFCLLSLGSCVEEHPTEQEVQPAKENESDLNADSSFGLGYGLAAPYLALGGINLGGLGVGGLGYGIGAYGVNYGGGFGGGFGALGQGVYSLGGKAFVIPVYNYGGLGGLVGIPGYGRPFGYPGGISGVLLGGRYGHPWGGYYGEQGKYGYY